MLRLEQWSEANLVDPEVPFPEAVRRQAKGIHEYPAVYGLARVTLRGLVAWLRAGVAQTGAEPLRPLRAAGARPDGAALRRVGRSAALQALDAHVLPRHAP